MNRTMMLSTAAGLGAIAGLRSLLAPALLSSELSLHRFGRWGGPIRRALASPRTAEKLRLLSLGEALVDKTSLAPSRVAPLPLFERAVCGAIVGAASVRDRRARTFGALLGATSAVIASHLAYRVRARVAPWGGVKNVLAGLVEDAIALSAGQRLAENVR
jgi:uncharacterized membrane protein